MFRALMWKEWRQLRQLRWVGAGLGVLLPMVALSAPRAARQGWIPFANAARGHSTTEVVMEALPLALAFGLWPLVALLMTSQSFAGDRSAGTESFLLERPVRRGRVWLARTIASFGSTLTVAGASLALWLLLATTVADPSSTNWSNAAMVLGVIGGLTTFGCFVAGMAAASLLSAPLAALLLGVVLAAVPVQIASMLGAWSTLATVAHVPIGMIVPALLLLAYPLAAYRASCRGEPAGRGRIVRGVTTLIVGLAVVVVLFVVSAVTTVRVLAHQLERGADIYASPGGGSTFAGSFGGWVIDLETGERLKFLSPPVWDATWNTDGTVLAMPTVSGVLGSERAGARVEFFDARGRSAGKTLRFEPESWARWTTWAGDRFTVYEYLGEGNAQIRVYDPATGKSVTSDAPSYTKFDGRTVERMSGLAGPTESGTVFAVINKDGALDGLPGVAYALHEIDLGTAEIADQPFLEDEGQPWFAGRMLSPSKRYWIVDRRASRGDTRPVLDLETGEEIEIDGLERARARWTADGDLVWTESSDGETRFVRAGITRPREVLRRWTDLRVGTALSPDGRKVLVVASRVTEEVPAAGEAVPTRRQVVETQVYDTTTAAWDELESWPAEEYEGWAYSTTWAGPGTLARTGPGVLALENLDRPGEYLAVVGSMD